MFFKGTQQMNWSIQGDILQRGSVWLVGAGPGDVELLTVKAVRIIKQATVVIFDRLISDEILNLIPLTTLRVNVGKSPRNNGFKQHDINQLLIYLANIGHKVVRLKNGDPFIFGRGGEEMLTLRQQGIECKIIPGITAALGCAADTCIPLTHRDYATSIQFITGHSKNGIPKLTWDTLSNPDQTLVFYMGLTWSHEISQGLIKHGRSAKTPVAIIENGTCVTQRVLLSTLNNLPYTLKKEKPISPSLIVIGEVVNFYKSSHTKI